MITAKLALPPIKFFGVHAAPATSQKFVRAVFFLDRSKNEMILRPMFPATSPFHFVIAKPAAKIALVQMIKDGTEIEVLAFLTKV